MSSKTEGNGQQNKPIVDEINELIEKERIVLSLKLQAQAEETQTWKSKFDALAAQLGKSPIELETQSPDEHVRVDFAQVDMHKIGHIEHETNECSWVFSIHTKNLDKVQLGKSVKSVFGVNNAAQFVSIANCTSCEFGDDFTVPILNILRCPRLLAIDLSRNNLGEQFFIQLINYLKERRITPQYLLLEDNVPFSKEVKHFSALLDVLTEQTWGVSVSLRDFTDVAMTDSRALPKKKQDMLRRKEPNYDYKETVKQPMLAHDFLRTFNLKLDPIGENEHVINTSKFKKQTMPSVASLKATVFGRGNGLHKMTCFGLKFCQLSKKTISTLQRTLFLTAATLTDLDLSFAYTGYPGAEMLSHVLSSPSCQLTRLGIIGNAVGDAGAEVIGKSLRVNKTLTYLDSRSNNFSDQGLQSLLQASLDGKVRNHVLFIADIRNNPDISLHAVQQTCSKLLRLGSSLNVRFMQEESVNTEKIQDNFIPEVYSFPQLIRRHGQTERPVLLYSVDVSTLQHTRSQPTLVFRWRWRVAAAGNHNEDNKRGILDGTTGAFARRPTFKGEGERESPHFENAAYFALGVNYFPYVEVKLTVNKQTIQTLRFPVAIFSASTRRLFNEDGECATEWISSSCVLHDVPVHASVEIYTFCTSSLAEIADAQAGINLPIVFESRQMTGHVFSPNAATHSPLFSNMWPAGSHEFEGSQTKQTVSVSPWQVLLQSNNLHERATKLRGMDVLNALRWPDSTRNTNSSFLSPPVQLRWKSKLCVYGIDEESSKNLPPQYELIGYQWATVVIGNEGRVRVCGEGTLWNNEEEKAAWTWQQLSLNVAANIPLHSNDQIILLGKPISGMPNFPGSVLQQCFVKVNTCEWTQGEVGDDSLFVEGVSSGDNSKSPSLMHCFDTPTNYLHAVADLADPSFLF